MAEKGMETIMNGELADQVRSYTDNLRKVFGNVLKKTKSKDGRLGAPDILQVQRALGMNPSESEIHEMIYKHDTDGSSRLSEDEFIYAMVQKMEIHDTEDEILQIFRMFDKDGNGFIDPSELKSMFEFACGPNTGITMSEINDLLEELDLDGNSLLDYNEFVKIFAQPNQLEEDVQTKKPVRLDV